MVLFPSKSDFNYLQNISNKLIQDGDEKFGYTRNAFPTIDYT